MKRKPRTLRPEERELWQRVAAQSRPLHPERPHPVKQAVEQINHRQPAQRLQDFRVGQASRPSETAHNLMPQITDHLRNLPLQMDRKAYGKMKRGKLDPQARIDLHGMTLARAHPALTGFILRCHSEGRRLVLVITGKGRGGAEKGTGPIPERRGVLRQQVPHWLMSPPLGALVLQVTPAHIRHGGEGAYYVYLRRSR
ncbi:MAG TPA: DNA mismatch repair protein MutS [Rhodobacteraceae bacterium]|nr:DNA mismatch repair protein MutS [Paracoccaceae bacterium]